MNFLLCRLRLWYFFFMWITPYLGSQISIFEFLNSFLVIFIMFFPLKTFSFSFSIFTMSFYKPMSVESLGTCEKAEDFYEFNREPILRTILLNTEPPTEVLADDDEGPDFVAQKRRNRRSSKASVSFSNQNYLFPPSLSIITPAI